jgi:outer membrane immunogenic protein
MKLMSSFATAALLATSSLFAASPASADGWTGFYVNGGGGYGSWTANTTTLDPTTGVCDLCVPQKQGGNGAFFTIGGGYDQQVDDNFVPGLFVDGDFGHISGTLQDQGPFYAGHVAESTAWDIGARGGWLVTPAVMPYLDAGYTQAHFTGAAMVDTFGGAATGYSLSSSNHNGWFVGAGAEIAVSPGWSVKGEYRIASYDKVNLTDTSTSSPANDDISFRPNVQTFRIEVVYRFAPGP